MNHVRFSMIGVGVLAAGFIAATGAVRPALAAEIHEAAGAGDVGAVTALLDGDAALAARRDGGGLTPLHAAARANRAGVVVLLLSRHADPAATAADGATPLDLALTAGAGEAAAELLERTDAAYTAERMGGRLLPPQTPADRAALARAEDVLNGLVRQRPASVRVNFALGMVALALGHHGAAQLAFDRVLQAEPGNDRARLELGRAALGAGQAAAAREAFETVLAHRPPPAVERQVRELLGATRKGDARRSTGVRVDAGVLWDDNANLGAASRTIDIAPITYGAIEFRSLELDGDSRPAEGVGPFAAASWGGVWDVAAAGGWKLDSQAGYFQTWLDDPDLSSLSCRAGVGARYVSASTFLLAPARYTYAAHGGDTLAHVYGVYPLYARVARQWRDLAWLVPVQCEWRDYDDVDDRDGLYLSLGQGVRRYLAGGRHALGATVTVLRDETDADDYRNTAVACDLEADVGLPRRFTFYVAGRALAADYEGREALAPEDRNDTQWQALVGLAGPLSKHTGIEARYQLTANRSTFDLYDYDRHVATLGMWVAF